MHVMTVRHMLATVHCSKASDVRELCSTPGLELPDRRIFEGGVYFVGTLQKQKGCFNPAWLPQLQLHCQAMYLQAYMS